MRLKHHVPGITLSGNLWGWIIKPMRFWYFFKHQKLVLASWDNSKACTRFKSRSPQNQINCDLIFGRLCVLPVGNMNKVLTGGQWCNSDGQSLQHLKMTLWLKQLPDTKHCSTVQRTSSGQGRNFNKKIKRCADLQVVTTTGKHTGINQVSLDVTGLEVNC